MKIAEADILIIPDLNGSGSGHWQQRWVEKMANARIVAQDDWDTPRKDDWVQNIERAVMMATRPVVIVAHSLGVAAVVHAAGGFADTKVRGALLVSPPDLDENPDVPRAALPFANVPRDPLPFPSLLLASSNDPFCSVARAMEFANCWGSEYHNAGEAGHINSESGHGPWPEGLMMFTRLMQRLKI